MSGTIKEFSKNAEFYTNGQISFGAKEPILKIKFLKKDNLFSDKSYARMYFNVENKSDALVDY
jgi:hypothetical protein